jgi:hypothetical protein
VADLNGWDDTEVGIELQSTLEGQALSIALSTRASSFTEICRTLKERLVLRPDQARKALEELTLTKDEVDALATQVKRLTELGYGKDGFDLQPEILTQEQIQIFLRAIHPKEMAHLIKIQNPKTLDQAAALTKDYLTFEDQHNPSRKIRAVQVDSTAKELLESIQQLQDQVKQLQTTNQTKRVTCKICGDNHYPSGCPNKKPVSENFSGPRH